MTEPFVPGWSAEPPPARPDPTLPPHLQGVAEAASAPPFGKKGDKDDKAVKGKKTKEGGAPNPGTKKDGRLKTTKK